LALAGCVAVLLGAKLWLIAGYGSSTPYWDEWAIADRVLRPYLSGTLSLADLAAPHNEHRVLLTRLSALSLFILSGRWDPVLEAMFNALLHAATIGLLVVALTRGVAPAGRLALALFAALLFAVPFGWQNVIFGFHSQYYFLILFGALSLWCLAGSAAFTPRWWAGTLLAAASYFAVALGALVLPAFMVLAVMQFAVGQRAGRAELAGLLLHLLLTAALLWDIPASAPDALKPDSLAGLLDVVAILASWPVAKMSSPQAVRILAAVLIYLPVTALALALLRERAPIADGRWVLVAIGGWAALLILAAAQARGISALSSRYYDLFLIGLLANGASLVHAVLGAERRRVAAAVATVWLIAVMAGVGHKAFGTIPGELAWRRETEALQTRHLTQFLATGDFSALAGKPQFHIPYPAAEPLRDWVTDPAIRSILPDPLFGQPDRDRLKASTLHNGPLLLPVGFALFIVATLLAGIRRPRD
jgi:hypothetical protein